MASSNPVPQLTGLARKLVAEGLIDAQKAAQAAAEATKKRTSLVSFLTASKLVSSSDVANAASAEFGFPVLDLLAIEIDPEVAKLASDKLINQHRALPIFKRGNRLYLAISDPTNLQAMDEIKFATGLSTEPVLVEDDKLERVIEKVLEASETSVADMLDDDLENLDIQGEDEDSGPDVSAAEVDDAPVVKYINKVLLDAINKGASDIHFEPYEKRYRIRLRIDGVLREIANPPVNLAPKLTARVKVMSRMDIAERRVPQDGRIKMKLSRNRAIDFRVNTCPTLFGEKVVLRILDPSSAKLGIEKLGYEDDQRQLYEDALANPYGMILVTGPTGSGKTVSLYTGLNILNTEDRNISTAEDPAEINMEGINQVNVYPKVGLTFANALRAFLRQDPDVIMVGEIRDLETAEIAIKAAQTGHLVLSTLHTNDAPQTLTRLMNMGVPPYNIATSVNLIIAQRLGRRLCPGCKKPHDVPREALLEEGFTEAEIKAGLKIYSAVGCDQCVNGYKGRVGIYQVMPISEEMQRLIMEGANAIALATQANKEGVADLRQSALKKVKDGLISLEEANRVTLD
jgi:type IV pilus assembly protein PilB